MRRLIAVIALLALLAACGGGGKKNDAKGSGSTTSTAAGGAATTAATTAGGGTATTVAGATPTTAVPNATDEKRIEKLVLIADDFPSGWKGTASRPPTAPDQSEREFASCIGASDPTLRTAHQDGDSFSNSDNTQASAEASTVANDAAFKADEKAYQGSKLAPCLKEQFTKEMQAESGGGGTITVDVADLSAKKHGDVTVGRRITITAKAATGQAKIYVDIVYMGKGRAEVVASFLNVNAAFDSDLEKTLVDKLGKRVDAIG